MNHRHAPGAPALVLLGSLLLSCGAPEANEAPAPTAADVDDAVLREADAHAGDWLTHGRTHGETRFSPLDRIHEGNVDSLGLAWSFDTGMRRGHEATPLVVDGTVYTTSAWSAVFALDARTGELLWKWDPEVDRARGRLACCDVVNRGVALYRGKVYVGVLDGRLAALDAGTGELVWETTTVDESEEYTITGAPRVVDGKVLIGNGGAEYGVRGYLTAYDAESGERVWRTYTVPGNPAEGFESEAMERAAETWSGEWWEYGGGGTVWDGMAYDPELDLLYVGTGNGSPWNRHIRSPEGGDNLYVSSILALRPGTGELVWHYQTTPGETWDYTATQPIVLANLEIEGEERKVLMQAPKNGFFYVLDRATGELISAEPFVDVTWAKGVDPETGRPIENAEARYPDGGPVLVKPGPLGAHNWHPMSFSPETGLVYIPAQDNSFVYADVAEFTYQPGAWNTGVNFAAGAGIEQERPAGHLLAWDPVAGEERWRVPYGDMWNGGVLSTAGNLVFQGTSDGRFVAYAADSGRSLWEVAAGTGVVAAPVTYESDGTQYVAVMAGWGGAYATAGGQGGRHPPISGRLLVFALGGRGTVAAGPAPEREPPAPIPSDADPAAVRAGADVYAQRCAVCHGTGAVSGAGIPDLRYSAPSTVDSLAAIVLEGARADLGMPSFGRWLEPEDVEALRAYVLDRRAEVAGR